MKKEMLLILLITIFITSCNLIKEQTPTGQTVNFEMNPALGKLSTFSYDFCEDSDNGIDFTDAGIIKIGNARGNAIYKTDSYDKRTALLTEYSCYHLMDGKFKYKMNTVSCAGGSKDVSAFEASYSSGFCNCPNECIENEKKCDGNIAQTCGYFAVKNKQNLFSSTVYSGCKSFGNTKVCNQNEICQDGNCINLCGNGIIDNNENCDNCPEDIKCDIGLSCRNGHCINLCGNGIIDNNENCDNCPADAGCRADKTCQNGVCTSPCPNDETWVDNQCVLEECSPILYHGNSDQKFSFIVAFSGLSQEEIDAKGRDLARAQFYRSQYNHTDPDFGFLQFNNYLTRAGLFEIEPFKSNTNKFNIFYLKTPLIEEGWDYTNRSFLRNFVGEYCTFIQNLTELQDYSIVVLKHQNDPGPSDFYNLEQAGILNHELGHEFDLGDEYYYDLSQNNLNQNEISTAESRSPNCDYGRPFSPEDYESGTGYCTKWCNGVNPINYQIYRDQLNKYNQCYGLLEDRNNKEEWLDFCNNQLNFDRYLRERGIRYIPLYINDVAQQFSSIPEVCETVFDNPAQSVDLEKINRQVLCYAGSAYSIWDLDIGQDCIEGTGCYPGCGGLSREHYIYTGSFIDIFRPNRIAIMGGGGYPDMTSTFLNNEHRRDNELPSYGEYNIEIIAHKFDELGLS